MYLKEILSSYWPRVVEFERHSNESPIVLLILTVKQGPGHTEPTAS